MRSGFDEVPGCMGIGRKDKHYCRFSGTSYYEYEKIGTCETGQDKWQGPAPFANKSNLAISFFAFGDTPYDDACSECNTCIGIDGNKEDSCTRFDCILKSISMSELPVNNTCTYEGPDYECLKQGIIPYLNAYAGDEAAFVAHVGDIMSECLSYDSIFYARYFILTCSHPFQQFQFRGRSCRWQQALQPVLLCVQKRFIQQRLQLLDSSRRQ